MLKTSTKCFLLLLHIALMPLIFTSTTAVADPVLFAQVSISDQDGNMSIWNNTSSGDTIQVSEGFKFVQILLRPAVDHDATNVYHHHKTLPKDSIWSKKSFGLSDTLSFTIAPGVNTFQFQTFNLQGNTVQNSYILIEQASSGFLLYYVSIIVFLIVLAFFIVVGNNRSSRQEGNLEPDYKHLLAENESILEVINIIIDENIDDNSFSSKTIQEKLSLSRSKLSNIIKKETNLTVKDYIHNHRLDKAKEMYNTGQFNIDTISQKLGFNSTSFLEKSYQKRFHHPIDHDSKVTE